MAMKTAFVPMLIVALALAPALGAQEPADTELETLTVTAPARPSWERSSELLRLMVEKSSPCLGCDAVMRPEAQPVMATLQDYLLQPAHQVDEVTTLARHVKLQDSPDLQYLRR